MLKLKEGFVLREVAGQVMAIPSGDELDLNAMITLNETGRFLWEHLQIETTEQELVEALLSEYEVDRDTAEKAVSSFVAKLNEYEFLA